MAGKRGEAAEAGPFNDGLTPFSIRFTVRGVRDFFFNAPNVDAYVASDERRKAGIKRQETDFEPKVWRVDGGLAVPGSEFIKAIKEMGRGFPDPTKSGARSLRPIVPLALAAHEEFCPFVHRNGKGEEPVTAWDVVDERLGKLGTKMGPVRRPKLLPGWTTSVTIDCTWPHVFPPAEVVKMMGWAGMRGIGDAVTIGYGRFVTVGVEEPTEIAWT